MSDIIAIDFFCGAGGVTKGFRNAGIDVVKGFDIDVTAKETYEKNNPNSTFIIQDVKKLSASKVLDGVNINNREVLFVGCAPCQPFSSINKKNSGGGINTKYDRRKSLILYFASIIEKLLPEYIFVENVPRFSRPDNIYFKKFIRILKRCNYNFDYSVIDAKNYGVPQTRRRFILLGARNFEIKIPEGSHGPGKLPYMTVKDVISKYPKLDAGGVDSTYQNHVARLLSSKNLERIKNVKSDGGSRKDLPENLILKCHETHTGHADVYGRMSWNKPSPTLTCKCTSITNGRFGHPVQNRGISIREAAALQTFPDDYLFFGNQTDVTRQVGNAVPVLLAELMAKIFLKLRTDNKNALAHPAMVT